MTQTPVRQAMRKLAGQSDKVAVCLLRMKAVADHYSATGREYPWADVYVTPSQAARAIGRHRTSISRAIARGDLRSTLVGGRHVIELVDFADYLARREPRYLARRFANVLAFPPP